MDFNDTRKIPMYTMDFTKMQLLGAGKNPKKQENQYKKSSVAFVTHGKQRTLNRQVELKLKFCSLEITAFQDIFN